MKLINKIKSILNKLLIPLIEDNSLKSGVSALVCCRDEEYNIELSLQSILGLVDQIVCIDHNSTDLTYNKMLAFQEKYKGQVDIVVEKYEHSLLKDARNFGLSFVKYKWLLNMGGDFVFRAELDEVKLFFTQLKNDTSLSSFRLSFVNLYGDLRHTYSNGHVYGQGEFYIVRKNKFVYFKESGKFDYLYFPKIYIKKSLNTPFFFHLSGLKSDTRLLYRDCYFEWREVSNYLKRIGDLQSPYHSFDFFEEYWRNYLYETTNLNSLKYRIQRQLCELEYMFYDQSLFCQYPQIIQNLLSANEERFIVQYENGKPYIRIDKEDEEMKSYIPSDDDRNWSVAHFKERYYSKNYILNAKFKNYEVTR